MNARAPEELDGILARLSDAVRRRFGNDSTVCDARLATLGGSNRTLLFSLRGPGVRRPLVLRQETIPQSYTPFLPAATQYRVLCAAARHDVPVPEPVFELEPADDLGAGYVVAAIAGETLPKRLLHAPHLSAARARFLEQAGRTLARLHAIDVSEFAVLEQAPDSEDPLAAQVAHYDRYGEPHPGLEFAFRWLERERPAATRRRPLHGDFRTGNMIVSTAGLAAVLDWECAHLGDPLEDLGWFCTRSWRFGRNHYHAGGFGDRERLYRAYEAAGGAPVDRAAARWWEIFGLLRWAIYNIMQVYGHVSGVRRSPAFAACGRNTCLIEYDLLMSIAGRLD